jgi:hypothetical protein
MRASWRQFKRLTAMSSLWDRRSPVRSRRSGRSPEASALPLNWRQTLRRKRKVEVSFNDLALPDGKHFQLQTSVTPGSGQLVRFVAAAESKERKGIKDAAFRKDQTGQGTSQAGVGQCDEAAQDAGPHASADTIRRGTAAGSCAIRSDRNGLLRELNAPLDSAPS